MLGESAIDVMLLATDLEAARAFYAERLGLQVLISTDEFLTFACGGDSRLVVTRSSSGTSEAQTKASWRVRDIAGEVAQLRSRGVAIIDYDGPGLTTEHGIADVGFALAAWFADPAGNTLGLLQFKDSALACST
jgi:catechol-2,3-dioxygenase